jgi:hypothetical protein
MTTLTAAGRKWAEANAEISLVARVALYGSEIWPAHHVDAAIRVANEEGALKLQEGVTT